jgi:predicted small secreted protein
MKEMTIMRNFRDVTRKPGLPVAATLLAALLMAAPVARADVGDDLAPAGQSIKKAAQDTGTAIENGAKDVGQTVEQKTAPAVATVKEGAQETGNFFQRTAKDVHDGAQAFFTKVGNFFSGK